MCVYYYWSYYGSELVTEMLIDELYNPVSLSMKDKSILWHYKFTWHQDNDHKTTMKWEFWKISLSVGRDQRSEYGLNFFLNNSERYGNICHYSLQKVHYIRGWPWQMTWYQWQFNFVVKIVTPLATNRHKQTINVDQSLYETLFWLTSPCMKGSSQKQITTYGKSVIIPKMETPNLESHFWNASHKILNPDMSSWLHGNHTIHDYKEIYKYWYFIKSSFQHFLTNNRFTE